MEASQLITACPTCGTVHSEIATRDATIADQQRTIGRLRGELRKVHEGKAPEQSNLLAWELWEFYRSELGVGENAVFDSARQLLADERLKDIPFEQLKRAIRGLKLKPYRGLDGGPIGRFAEKRPGTKKDIRFELVMRNAMTVDQFAGYVEEAELEGEQKWERHVQRVGRELAEDQFRHNGANLSDPTIPAEFNGLPTMLQRLEEHGCKVIPQPNCTASAQCPAHDDRDPSLSIRECDDGKVLVHCFAGCKTEDILGALGLAWGDLFGFDGQAENWGRR